MERVPCKIFILLTDSAVEADLRAKLDGICHGNPVVFVVFSMGLASLPASDSSVDANEKPSGGRRD